MKRKHREREQRERRGQREIVRKVRQRVETELLNGQDFDSNKKYLKELERWKR